MPARYPERIVCLTEETTETLYLLGEERRIVGISGYTVRPPQARREKPRVRPAKQLFETLLGALLDRIDGNDVPLLRVEEIVIGPRKQEDDIGPGHVVRRWG